ncbi:NAD dependent epimerase/dehydratase (plasmid) [Phaeobacter porticola]|uniref:NAD dependent epimerase/dehydratase n=2 Tax=Phaeobacter porticola TaxID=1844006 RepID=A0A1L3IAC0_9RHOB|nr:NAD dependent epimerase/dehydratase [Phaeobacter porticola]
MRDLSDANKTKPLMAMPGAHERLRLAAADTDHPESFVEALNGADALVIACLPSIRNAPDGRPAAELDYKSGLSHCVAPAQSACCTLIEAAYRSGLSDIVLLSSTASAEPETAPTIKNELWHHSDLESQLRQGKFIAAQKTAMELAATRLAEEHGLRLVILLSGMIVGPGVLPYHQNGHILGRLRNMARKAQPWHHGTPTGSMSMIHPQDLATLCMAALENSKADGRYFAVTNSWSWQQIYDEIAQFVPEVALPEPAPKGTEIAPPTRFDFTRRNSLASMHYDLTDLISGYFLWLDGLSDIKADTTLEPKAASAQANA